ERSFADEPALPAGLEDGLIRLWQLAAAAMAKGLEDTAFYRDFSLLALNEVGGDPRVVSRTTAQLHRRLELRARSRPLALCASATHDTKRGEDARLRLAMLSHHADEWRDLLPRLSAATRNFASGIPHPADEYLAWQTLAAILPPGGISDCETRESLAGRLREYLLKALREGKQRTSWLAPNEDYEATICDYAEALLDPDRGEAFEREMAPFAARLARDGALASLAALALKCTAPGVPDFYQGTEFWDLTLVDPDNRRPVDYQRRARALGELEPWIAGRVAGRARLVEELLGAWPDGRIKLYILASLLQLRRRRPKLFVQGGYELVRVEGACADDVLAFRRRHGDEQLVVLVARVSPVLMNAERCALDAAAWGDTRCAIGDEKPRRWLELLSGRLVAGAEFRLPELLSPLPAAVLIPAGGNNH
ncbi:MAG: malto-oligosyltrehalose synthase, partial [Gammaproteobacteria bacterium]|nr:malto-oligosyltrehalose synthase [Gammaproteobacteria bacterium]